MQDAIQISPLADAIVAGSRVANTKRLRLVPTISEVPVSSKATTATVFVVDNDRTFRETLRDLLVEEGLAVELFADGEAFLECDYSDRPGCLVIDARMTGLGGIELLERLEAAGRPLQAIVISGHADVPMAVHAMKVGAVDFLEKPICFDQLLDCIRYGLDKGQGIARSSALQRTAAIRVSSLTMRQHQVLDMIIAGHPSKNIAINLGISQRTVENHRAAIMRTTGSKSIPALVQTAISARRTPIIQEAVMGRI